MTVTSIYAVLASSLVPAEQAKAGCIVGLVLHGSDEGNRANAHSEDLRSGLGQLLIPAIRMRSRPPTGRHAVG